MPQRAKFLSSMVGTVTIGPYRGEVVDNNDKDLTHRHLGRIKVRVPQLYGVSDDVTDDDLPWAWPMFLMGGGVTKNSDGKRIKHGLVSIPPVGSTVWIFLEQGDPQRPLWSGTWYGERDTREDNGGSEMPEEALVDPSGEESYPNIWLLKFPWNKDGIWLRCTGDRKFEIMFAGNSVTLKSNADDEGGSIDISATSADWDVNVTAAQGNINLTVADSDKSINLISAGSINLKAGKTINAEAGETSTYKATKDNIFASDKAIRGKAPEATGFHGMIVGPNVWHTHK